MVWSTAPRTSGAAATLKFVRCKSVQISAKCTQACKKSYLRHFQMDLHSHKVVFATSRTLFSSIFTLHFKMENMLYLKSADNLKGSLNSFCVDSSIPAAFPCPATTMRAPSSTTPSTSPGGRGRLSLGGSRRRRPPSPSSSTSWTS